MIANLPGVVKGNLVQQQNVSFLLVFVLALGVAMGIAACGRDEAAVPAPATAGSDADVSPVLAAHTAEFERRVYRVTEGVHVAVGFGLANSILVEGDDCAFVVDVLASREKGEEVRAQFEAITRKPIEALVYTHNHADHVFGGRGFVPEGPVDVYAHETTSFYIDRLVSVLRPIISTRSERMFGNQLPASGPDRFVNAGIGPALELAHGEGTVTLIRPNRTFAHRLDTEICGVAVELVHAPGETPDQIFVWLPERSVLMPGDNVYKAFPNLYTIRGTPYRDVLDWVRSLDAMRALGAEHLVPSHTRPVSGREAVAEILTAYRDAIQYVHDQTVRGMNRGLGPDELVEEIELPPHLKSHPYLAELCARSSAATWAGSAATARPSRRRHPRSGRPATSLWRAEARRCSGPPARPSRRGAASGPRSWRATSCASSPAIGKRGVSRPRPCATWADAVAVPTAATSTSPRPSSSREAPRWSRRCPTPR